MVVYWLLLLFFSIGALASRDGMQSDASKFGVCGGAVLLVLVIGLRYQVGGDWSAYERMYKQAAFSDVLEMLRYGDPAYQLLNWVVQWFEWPFWTVNVVCAMIFCWGLTRFAIIQLNPWLAMVVALPYLVIVVAMGYTRQATAIGVVMMGLAAMQRGSSIIRFSVYVVIAALFHKTAVVLFLLVAFNGQRNKLVNVLIVAAAALLLYDSLLQSSMVTLMHNYVDAKYSSQGAAIRISLCMVPGVLFFVYRKKLLFSNQSMLLWRNTSIAAFIALAALLTSPSSTVVDRIALYLLPLQLAILSQVPRIFSVPSVGKAITICYAFSIQFAWLNFASNAGYWVPYKSYIR